MYKIMFTLLIFVCSVNTQAREIHAKDLIHLGSYQTPQEFNWGGAGLALNAGKDGIYLSNWNYGAQDTAELVFPSALGGTMAFRQSAVDAYSGKRKLLGNDSGNGYRVGGMMVYQNELIMTAFAYYHGEAAKLSHFRRPLTLASAGVKGPQRVGPMNAEVYGGYMAVVPEKHRSAIGGPAVTGLCCTSIISRSSFGPSLHVFDPLSAKQTARPLVHYPEDFQALGIYGRPGAHPVFNGSTRITGVVFIDDSVLFIGGTGIGPYCYGTGAVCNDPVSPYKGEHAHPYRLWAWAYRVSDLAEVRKGSKRPWHIEPYQNWDLGIAVEPDFGTGGAAFDPVNRQLYVALRKGFSGKAAEVVVFAVSPNPSF